MQEMFDEANKMMNSKIISVTNEPFVANQTISSCQISK